MLWMCTGYRISGLGCHKVGTGSCGCNESLHTFRIWPETIQTSTNYLQTLNWCETHFEDKDCDLCPHIFTNLKIIFQFICQPYHEEIFVFAYCSTKPDFQFLHKYFISLDIIRQGKYLTCNGAGERNQTITAFEHLF